MADNNGTLLFRFDLLKAYKPCSHGFDTVTLFSHFLDFALLGFGYTTAGGPEKEIHSCLSEYLIA